MAKARRSAVAAVAGMHEGTTPVHEMYGAPTTASCNWTSANAAAPSSESAPKAERSV